MQKIFLLGLLLTQAVFAQSQHKKFFNEKGQPSTPEECYYYQVTGDDTHAGDTIRTFFCSNDNIRSIEPMNNVGMNEGVSLFYYENSRLRSRVTSTATTLELAETWYPDGGKQSEEYYDPDDIFNPGLRNYWDSLGNQIISNGNGKCRCIFQAHKESELLEVGTLVNGKRDLIWVGFKEGSKYFEETYSLGKLESGVSFDKEGNEYQYSKAGEMAAPKGGMNAFYAFVGANLKYPDKARRMGIEGKVFVEFIIEKDGSLSNIKLVKGIGRVCDDEALRVVSKSPKWTPAKQRGQLVKQRMILPMQFKLS